jgi:catechol 2,3-dioxygenase-like lactoylglutathione lyase family enzyme
MGLKLNAAYITIPVSDLNRSRAWYEEHFGFRTVVEDPLYFELQNESGIRVLLLQNEHRLNSHIVYPNGAHQPSYGFIVDDAESVYRYLRDQGVKVGELFDYQGKSFSFYDPDGNYIEIWSSPENRL